MEKICELNKKIDGMSCRLEYLYTKSDLTELSSEELSEMHYLENAICELEDLLTQWKADLDLIKEK